MWYIFSIVDSRNAFVLAPSDVSIIDISRLQLALNTPDDAVNRARFRVAPP